MRIDYVLKRIGFFLLIIWLAATLNFFMPRLSGQNPVRERLLEQALVGGYVHAGMDEMVAEYEQRFGLDQPLWHPVLPLPRRPVCAATSTTRSPTTRARSSR